MKRKKEMYKKSCSLRGLQLFSIIWISFAPSLLQDSEAEGIRRTGGVRGTIVQSPMGLIYLGLPLWPGARVENIRGTRAGLGQMKVSIPPVL
jgi:hypothetical protein